MKQAVVYVRVSSKEQKEEGYSIPSQKKLLWEYARVNSFAVAKEFEDDETAKSAGRAGFGEMVDFLKNNKKVDTILVEKTDRLYRNFKDYVTIDELGVTVFLVKENEKLGKDASSHQKFMHGIKVLMAKNYIDNLSEEVKKGLKEKAESGNYPCNAIPLGYILSRPNNKSVPVVDEKNRELVIKMFEYYSTSLYSLVTLLDKVKDEGLVVPDTFPKTSKLKSITKSSAQRILRNPFYYGDFLWRGKLYHGSHEPIISRQLWDKVQKTLDRFKKETAVSKNSGLFFTFKGLLVCGECGRTITAEKKTKPSGKEYTYYRCTKYKRDCSQAPISESDIDKQIAKSLEGLEMPQATIDSVTEALRQSFNLKQNTEDKTKANLEAEKNRLENRLSKLYEDKLDGNITKEFYDQKFNEYSNLIKDLDGKISKYTLANIDYYQFGSNILELANKAAFLYKMANPQEKRELLGFLLSDSSLAGKKLILEYKKPFQFIYKRVSLAKNPKAEATTHSQGDCVRRQSCIDWRGRWGSNPRPPAYAPHFVRSFGG